MDLDTAKIKALEEVTTQDAFPECKPVYARIDGRGFSKYTRILDKPFDIIFTNAMMATTKYVMEQTNATFAYSQSDEINLVWIPKSLIDENSSEEKIFFGGRKFKVHSVTASIASVYFANKMQQDYPQPQFLDEFPVFDCRAYWLPDIETSFESMLARQDDGIRNAIGMVVQQLYSHKQLQFKSTKEQLNMIHEAGSSMNVFHEANTRGWFFRKAYRDIPIEESNIPEKFRDPDQTTVKRSFIENISMPNMHTLSYQEIYDLLITPGVSVNK